MGIDLLNHSAQWVIDTVPKAVGIQKVPALLPERTAANELKLNLRSYCQADTYSCGAIAGWSVLEYLNPQADFTAFYRDCAPSIVTGTSTTRLAKALRTHGITVSHRRGLDFGEINRCLQSGKPILVTVAEGALFDDDAAHWLVLYGCGWKPNRVFLSGRTVPGFSRKMMSWRDFKQVWSPAGHGLVCSARGTRTVRKQKSR